MTVAGSTVMSSMLHMPVTATEDAVEVQQQRGLAGAVGADQCDLLARRHVELDAAQRLGSVRIGEVQVLDADPARRDGHQAGADRLTISVKTTMPPRTTPKSASSRSSGPLQCGRPEGAIEAARQHRRVDPLGALVGADEERADHGSR